MPNVIAIIEDDRVRLQTEQFLQELGIEGLRFATFKYHQEFTALYFRERKASAEPDPTAEAPAGGAAETEMKLFSEIHLVIFALDSIGEKSNPWIEKIKTNFKRFKYWPTNGPLRIVMLKYEDDNVSKLDVLHPLLDDLLYLPLDRLVFLQKMEILMHLPGMIKPRFLFNQEVKQEIEISKITKVDRLSDVGLAIRNPIPLKKGLPGHFYLSLPGEKNQLELRGKVIRNEPHPEYPGHYLVYFIYFAMSKTNLTTIRRALSKSPRYQSLFNDDRAKFRSDPDNIMVNPDETKTFGLAVIDPDPMIASNLALQISKDMDRLNVMAESSYSYFLHKYFDPRSTADAAPASATELSDFYQPKIRLTISPDLKCLNVSPPPFATNKFLGHVAEELFSTPDKWLTIVTDKGSRVLLEEAVGFALKGKASDKTLTLLDEAGKARAVNCHVEISPADHLVTLDFTPATLRDISMKIGMDMTNKELDAIILDSAFVPDDPTGFISGLRTRAQHMGLTKDSARLKFFVIADSEVRTPESWLNLTDIIGLFVKPVDTRQLMYMLSEYLPNKNTVYQFENLGWAQPSHTVHVSKSVNLEALSEFGAQLKSKVPIAPGTVIFLRRSIYVNAPNQCLAARVYACEQHQTDREYYQIYTTYFGINDQFLKFARTWIRENYASSKSKEN